MHPLLLLSKGLLIEGASAMPMISNTLVPFGGAGWYGVIKQWLWYYYGVRQCRFEQWTQI